MTHIRNEFRITGTVDGKRFSNNYGSLEDVEAFLLRQKIVVERVEMRAVSEWKEIDFRGVSDGQAAPAAATESAPGGASVALANQEVKAR